MSNKKHTITKLRELQQEITTLHAALENKKEEYRGLCKQKLGIADGEKLDVLTMFAAIYDFITSEDAELA